MLYLYKGGKMAKKKEQKEKNDYRIILQFPSSIRKPIESLAKVLGLRPSQFIKMKVLQCVQQQQEKINEK